MNTTNEHTLQELLDEYEKQVKPNKERFVEALDRYMAEMLEGLEL